MKNDIHWAYLAHLSTNMWNDKAPEAYATDYRRIRALSPKLLCDEAVWQTWTNEAARIGMNMYIVDVGDGVNYPSHPELALEGGWSPDKMRAEVRRLKALGLEPIPKLNFSTCHDSWLKEYHRMVSTPVYYRVCRDLLKDIYEIFDRPRYIHLGYDEEQPGNPFTAFDVVRQGELWWHDFFFFIKAVEDLGARPWVWADVVWHYGEEAAKRVPKSVLMANWYYHTDFDTKKKPESPRNKCSYVGAYELLEKYGFDQTPCGSNWGCEENFPSLVSFAMENISPERLKGFIMAPWHRTLPRYMDMGMRSFRCTELGMRIYRSKDAAERDPIAQWLLKPGMAYPERPIYPNDRNQLKPDEEMVLDFGIAAEGRMLLDFLVSGRSVDVTIRPAGRLDGKRAVASGAGESFTVNGPDARVVTPKLPKARYYVLTSTGSCYLTRATIQAG